MLSNAVVVSLTDNEGGIYSTKPGALVTRDEVWL